MTQSISLSYLAIQQQFLDLRHDSRGVSVTVGGASRPKAFLIELDGLVPRISIYHGPDSSISDRKSLIPILGRLAIP